MKLTITKSLLLFILLFSTLCVAAQDKGLEIAKKSKESDEGYESSQADLKMILTNKQGQTSTNLLFNKTLEVKNDGDKSIVEFNSPKDVKGTKTLTFTHKKGDDDQWIFLPSIARVFAFEDLSSFEVEKFTYKFIEETTLQGNRVAVVEMYPLDPKSGYTKKVGYFNLDKGYRFEKIEFYDRKNAKLKTQEYEGYKQYANKFWRADKLSVTNHQNGKKTDLIFSNYKFKVGLSDKDLTEESLKN
jgi:uncharacterized protein